MRTAILCLILFPLASQADVKNPLTAKEISDGWLLLYDGSTTFGWQQSKDAGWKVNSGLLTAPAKKESVITTTSIFGDGELRMEYQVGEGGRLVFIHHCDAKGDTNKTGGQTQLPRLGGKEVVAKLKIAQGQLRSGSFHAGGGGAGFGAAGNAGGAEPPPNHLGFRGLDCTIKSIKFLPSKTKSIFNGKDLDGWRIHPGRKSKFTVTKDGELHVENGNGDLQTKEEWSDFLLQLECKVNGKNLNSGIFFRCLPNQYQQGYEAQIHNGFDEKKEKTYTLQQYDPKTHKETKKIKVESHAKDYGTGGIYRRQPARFQAAKDGEWFTMTVLAHGRHLATWVNGIQVADWTDNRPLKDNARQGCRLKKGCISIQGHDPTTDLSFRNFRIVSYSK